MHWVQTSGELWQELFHTDIRKMGVADFGVIGVKLDSGGGWNRISEISGVEIALKGTDGNDEFGLFYFLQDLGVA